MIQRQFEHDLLSAIQQKLGQDFQQAKLYAIAGGQTHQAFRLESNHAPLFLKLNSSDNKAVLESEYQSLCLLAETSVADLYPSPVFLLEVGDVVVMGMTFLAMADIDGLNARRSAHGLIKHHQVQAPYYGWSANNFIGVSPQSNDFSDSWLVFFRNQRLLPQLAMARCNGLDLALQEKTQTVADVLQNYLPTTVQPCLLHGDLWSGNLAYSTHYNGLALYDPAPYYGDPESDIAMTTLFGQLPKEFYLEYRQYFDVPNNEHVLHSVYNLYHALNHFNLFGNSYESMIKRLLDFIN